MAKIVFSRIGWLVFLLALQILIFNHVHIAGFATSFAYIYLLLILPNNTPKSLFVVLGFAMGLIVDVFNNTPGVSAAATTAVGLLSPYLFQLLGPKEENDDNLLVPGANVMGWPSFSYYAFIMCTLQCLLFFVIENFNFHEPLTMLIEIVSSTAFTFIVVMAFEWVRNSKQH